MHDVLPAITEFHRSLIHIDRSRVPINVGICAQGHALESRLDRIERLIQTRLELDQPITQIMAEEDGLPKRYRILLSSWIKADRDCQRRGVLAAAVEPAMARASHYQMISRHLWVPATILIIGAAVLAMQAPALANTLKKDIGRPSQSLRVLGGIGEYVDVWFTALIAIMVLAVIGLWGYWRYKSLVGRPIHSIAESYTRCAQFASLCADQLESGTTINDAMAFAAPMAGEARFTSAIQTMVVLRQRDQPIDPQDERIEAVPAVMRHLVLNPPDHEPLAPLWRSIAEHYRHQRNQFSFTPSQTMGHLIALAIGGMIVLAIACVLYLPVIQSIL